MTTFDLAFVAKHAELLMACGMAPDVAMSEATACYQLGRELAATRMSDEDIAEEVAS